MIDRIALISDFAGMSVVPLMIPRDNGYAMASGGNRQKLIGSCASMLRVSME